MTQRRPSPDALPRPAPEGRLGRRALLRGSVGLAAAWALACDLQRGARPAATALGDGPLDGLTDLEGAPLRGVRTEGRVLVLDFWASWCSPCRASFRALEQLHQQYAASGLYILGVCVDDDPKAGRAFVSRIRPHFAIAWDPSFRVRARYDVSSLPTTCVIDGRGVWVRSQVGYDRNAHRQLESLVRSLLQEV